MFGVCSALWFIVMPFDLIPRLTNVVVTAQHHRPAMLNTDFLSACGIVPENWHVVDSSTSEGLSIVEFHNGVFWSLDRDNLIIEDDRGFDFRGEIEIHNLARDYVREVRRIPYRALGLNFYLAFLADDPHAWIADRFMPADLNSVHGHGIRVLPRFSVSSGGATVTVMFGGPETGFENPSLDDAVLISVHVYREALGSGPDILAALENWPATQAVAVQAVSLLLGGQ